MRKDHGHLIRNIYYMFSYAFQTLEVKAYAEVATEDFPDMQNLFAAILAKGISWQIKQGLSRSYEEKREVLAGVRGCIDMPESMRLLLRKKRRLFCEFDELSENHLLNQVIKTTVMLLLRHGSVEPKYRKALKKQMLFFSQVDVLRHTSISWNTIRYQRNQQNYRMLLAICQMIIEGLLQTDQQGTYHVRKWMDTQRMSHLYEKFILAYYQRHFPTLSVSAPQIPWVLDEGDGELLPVMQTDMQLEQGGNVLIIDAKYYRHILQSRYETVKLRSAHLYQIFTYVKNRAYERQDGHRVSGMLLYAGTDEALQPDHIYQMHGNQIEVKTLDLSRPFEEIAGALDAIVNTYFPSCFVRK